MKDKAYVFVSNSTKPSPKEYRQSGYISLSSFNRPCLLAAQRRGYDVILGINRKNVNNLKCDEMDIGYYNQHTYRNIFNFFDIYIAYYNLKKIVKNNNVEVIHCNTPIGGLVTRIVAKNYPIKTIIYTAHGFHFYPGGNKFKNLVFRTAESVMAKWTDAIITMNSEDYKSAMNLPIKGGNKNVFFVHGVGIDTSEYKKNQLTDEEKRKKRKELGLKEDDYLVITSGDLVKRKNHKMIIEAFKLLSTSNIHLLICGTGPEEEKLRRLVNRYNLDRVIHFLGFRTDIKELLLLSNVFILASKQEGLPRSVMEAMASGLPCIVTDIRGNRELIDNEKGGYLISLDNTLLMCESIRLLINNPLIRQTFGKYNQSKILDYDNSAVTKEIEQIYRKVLEDDK